ncbi:hypothetical protein N6H14_21160 [Paenibacillus sp. CC-CFT747]|nr:hypothetical protein N6H14_21160 [Paenibacillus sp. CC-CFT747]
MRFAGGRLFLSAYVGGDHIVYDPKLPWDQLYNNNPKTLRPVRPAFIRPEGRSVIGPDGAFWTGWSAKYGTYGGALSRVNTDTLEVEHWADPVPEQQVCGLTSDDRYLYFTTNGGASGLGYKNEPCHFGVWSPDKGLVHLHTFEPDVVTGNAVLADGDRVFVGAGPSVRLFDPASMSFISEMAIDEPCSWMIRLNDALIGVFSGSRLLLMSRDDLSIVKTIPLPGRVRTAVIAGKEQLYFAVEATIYRFELEELLSGG